MKETKIVLIVGTALLISFVLTYQIASDGIYTLGLFQIQHNILFISFAIFAGCIVPMAERIKKKSKYTHQ